MDALSDVLKAVRLEGALYLNAEFTAPWSFLGKHGRTSIRERLAGAEHVVYFHFLTEGDCKVRLADGGDVLDVAAGDLVLFPQDDRHLMGSDLHLALLEGENLIKAAVGAGGDPEFLPIRHGGGGVVTRFVCGYLACSRSMCRPLLEALPRVLRIPIGDGQASALVRELLRVGVRDAHVGRALALLHGEPGRPWTVDELAREAVLSRSALAERSGYESEAAFSRAFKREFGMPPAAWRKAGTG